LERGWVRVMKVVEVSLSGDESEWPMFEALLHSQAYCNLEEEGAAEEEEEEEEEAPVISANVEAILVAAACTNEAMIECEWLCAGEEEKEREEERGTRRDETRSRKDKEDKSLSHLEGEDGGCD
jgi:hypothetical protein